MTLALTGTPFPITWRELWMPKSIRQDAANVLLSSSRGQALTLTGAQKRTTVDGVGWAAQAVNNGIDFGVIHNAAPKLWISYRVKLIGGGAPDRPLFSKAAGANDYIQQYMNGGSQFRVDKVTGGVVQYTLVGPFRTVNQWHHVLVSFSNVNGARLRVDNGAAATFADLSNAPNGGNFLFGWNPTIGAGMETVAISDIFIGNDDLTIAEENDLYNGIPPADATEVFQLDEGRGTALVNRGTSGAAGTVGSAATWNFGRVKRAVLAPDGINDYASSPAGVDISGDWTAIWVGKEKSTYNSISRGGGIEEYYLWQFRIDATHMARLYLSASENRYRFRIINGATDVLTGILGDLPAIDSYRIYVCVLKQSQGLFHYRDGSLWHSALTPVNGPGLGAATYIAARNDLAVGYDISKTLFLGLANGAFTAKQAHDFSRWINQSMNLGLTI